MELRVACPAPACRAVFEVPRTCLGRSIVCPTCGARSTARPPVQDDHSDRRVDPERLRFAVLVDNVRSLWNVGSIFRTADACGVCRLVLCGITGCPPRAEISKTSLGAEEFMAWEYVPHAPRALRELEAAGFVPVALESTPRAVDLDELRWPSPLCLVVGNEVAGVSPELLAACALHASIPMRGVKRSLNVAVAFGIAAHAAASALAPRACSAP